jgi:hypothetical protein
VVPHRLQRGSDARGRETGFVFEVLDLGSAPWTTTWSRLPGIGLCAATSQSAAPAFPSPVLTPSGWRTSRAGCVRQEPLPERAGPGRNRGRIRRKCCFTAASGPGNGRRSALSRRGVRVGDGGIAPRLDRLVTHREYGRGRPTRGGASKAWCCRREAPSNSHPRRLRSSRDSGRVRGADDRAP